MTSRKSRLYHQDAIAQRLLAVAGGVTAREGDATQEFVVRLFRDECTVSADASGELLHRRGYRLATAKAPLRETLAAAMLVASGWDGSAPLVDPMCGSGTIPIEAALMARRVPPGMARRFAFMRWPGFDRSVAWERLARQARERALPRSTAPILGSDRDAGAVSRLGGQRRARRRRRGYRVAARRHLRHGAATGARLDRHQPAVRCSRWRTPRSARNLYAQLGNVARRCCPGWELAFLAAHPELERQTGLEQAVRFTTENGGIRVRLVQGRVRLSS